MEWNISKIMKGGNDIFNLKVFATTETGQLANL